MIRLTIDGNLAFNGDFGDLFHLDQTFFDSLAEPQTNITLEMPGINYSIDLMETRVDIDMGMETIALLRSLKPAIEQDPIGRLFNEVFASLLPTKISGQFTIEYQNGHLEFDGSRYSGHITLPIGIMHIRAMQSAPLSASDLDVFPKAMQA